jgi:hypothetical protein
MGMGAGWYSSWSTFSHGPAQIQKQKGRQAAKTKKNKKWYGRMAVIQDKIIN